MQKKTCIQYANICRNFQQKYAQICRGKAEEHIEISTSIFSDSQLHDSFWLILVSRAMQFEV